MTKNQDWEKVKNNIMGFGDENSSHKMYYPELQKKLKELDRFKQLMDNVNDLVIQVDIYNETIVYANNSALSILNYNKDEIRNTVVKDIFKDTVYNDIKGLIFDDSKEGRIILSEIKTSDGEIIPVEINYHLQEFDDSLYAVLIARSIQEKIIVEGKLIESEASMHRVFNNIYDIIVIHDNNGNIIKANTQALELFELTVAEIKSMNIIDISAKTEQINNINDIYDKAMMGEYMIFEWKGIKHHSNIVFDIEVALRKIEWFGQEVILSVMRDISQRKALEDGLIRSNKELELRVKERTIELETTMNSLQKEIQVRKIFEQNLVIAKEELIKALEKEKELNNLKSRFVSMVSHEYRTPLTIILSSTYLLDIYHKNQKELEFNKQLTQIQKAVQEMTKMLNDVLNIGRIASGNYTLEINTFSLNDSIKESVGIIDDFTNGQFVFNLDLPDTECLVTSDSRSIITILNNLINNAVKFSNSYKEIDISLCRNDDNHFDIRIKDRGIGIPANEMKNLYEPFFRAKNIGNISGTGLGLAIVKNTLELLQGKIQLNSFEGEGTDCIITLPKSIYPS